MLWQKALPIWNAMSTTSANHYGLPCVVAINHFTFDTDAEIELLRKKWRITKPRSSFAGIGGRRQGRRGTGRTVIDIVDKVPVDFQFVYEDQASLWTR